MMKVLAVNPGRVLPLLNGRFGYSIDYKGPVSVKVAISECTWSTASEAKQAMREKVAHERKRHGLVDER